MKTVALDESSNAERQARFRERHGPPVKVYLARDLRLQVQQLAQRDRQTTSDFVRDAVALLVQLRQRERG